MEHRTLCLVDMDSRRRASAVHQLASSHIHVEPFESVTELFKHQPRAGEIIVAYDEDDVISALVKELVMSSCAIIAFCQEPSARRIVRAVQEGVDDYLSWPFSAEEVRSAMTRVSTENHPQRSIRAREIAARQRLERLTAREIQVLTGLAGGQTNRDIAHRLQISPRTVEIHRSNMLRKIQAPKSADAIRLAIEANLGDEP